MFNDEVEEQDTPVYTSHNLICGHPSHQRDHTLAMFSRPAATPYAAFLLLARDEGWQYDGTTHGCWLCPECAGRQ